MRWGLDDGAAAVGLWVWAVVLTSAALVATLLLVRHRTTSRPH